MSLVALSVLRLSDASRLVATGRPSYSKSRGVCPCENFCSCLKVRFGPLSHGDAFANILSVFPFLCRSTCLAWTESINNKQLKDSLIASFWVFALWSAWGHMAGAMTLGTCLLEPFLRCWQTPQFSEPLNEPVSGNCAGQALVLGFFILAGIQDGSVHVLARDEGLENGVVEETNVIFHNFPCSCIFEEREREMARLAVTCCVVINATATICFQPTTWKKTEQ